MQIFESIHLFVLIWIGMSVLWAVRLAYRNRGSASDDSIRLVLTILGWMLMLIGILGSTFQAFAFGGPFAWIIVSAIIIMAVGRYRHAENRTLVWCLAAAAERGIPLDQAARAYSMERSDELGLRAARLADLLEGGTPLSLALHDTRIRLPLDTSVAVRVGVETGDLGHALAKVSTYHDDADALLRSIVEKVFYLVLVGNFLVIMLTFIMWKIVPVFAKMFEEFGLALPDPTQLLVAISAWTLNYWFIASPLLIWLPFFLLFGMLHYVGWLPRNLPFINWFVLRLDGAIVMRCLALGVQQQRPLAEMIWLLTRLYPKTSVRRRLVAAGRGLNNGEHWARALHQSKLLRTSEVAVFMAAERSGNLEWALEEMADSSIRRLAFRLRLAVNVLFPIVLVVFGGFIGFVVISLFMPLVALIQGLS